MPRRVGAYAKLLAKYASDDAIIAAGEKAELLFVRALAFCATSDSDGYITDGQVERVVGAGMRDARARAQVLVRHGLWEVADGGYQVRSWMKIHESAEEKGRVRATDRERKQRERASESERSPSGQDPPSERNPEGVTPESLDCSYVSTSTRTEQSTAIQSSAGTGVVPDATTADGIIARWIEYVPQRPPGDIIGQVGKHVKAMLGEGIDPTDVARGVRAWADKGLHPRTLSSVVNEVMNAAPDRGRPRTPTASEKAQGWFDAGEKAKALIREQAALHALPPGA